MNNLLFSITMQHQYYDNGRMQNVSLLPDERTQVFLDQHGVITRQDQSVFSFYYFGSAGFDEFSSSLVQLLEQQALRFNICTDDQTFMNISDLPLNWLGMLRYSSRKIDPQTAGLAILLSVMTNGEKLKPDVIGEVSIYPDDLFDDRGRRLNTHYSINIKARKTQWNYYVFNPSRVKLDKPKISNRAGVRFDFPKRVTLDGDDNVLLFSSGTQRFALKESPHQTFDLLTTVQSLAAQNTHQAVSDKRLIKGLPTPSANQISIKKDYEQSFACSEMYVYL